MPVVGPLDPVASWADRLRSRLYEQFKGKPNLDALISQVWAPQMDQLEAAAQSLRTLFSIADSVGAQLDTIGRLVDQGRGGVDDATYRLYLYAKIRANKSKGAPEDLYGVLVAMLPGAQLALTQRPPKALEMQAVTPITPTQASVATTFLGLAKGAGTRAIFEWQEQADALTFTMALATTLTSGLAGAETSIAVVDTSAFPLAGSLLLDGGLANAETVTYTTTNGTHFATSAIANVHSTNASVELVGDAGLGFGDSTDASVGGKLAGAAQA